MARCDTFEFEFELIEFFVFLRKSIDQINLQYVCLFCLITGQCQEIYHTIIHEG